MRIPLPPVLILLVLVSITSCVKDPSPMRAYSSITLDSGVLVLDIGQRVVLTPRCTPEDAELNDLEWAVRNPDVASVSQTGEVLGLTAGSTEVSVRARFNFEVYASQRLIVGGEYVPVESIEIDPPSAQMVVGDALTLVCTVLPAHASDLRVTFASDREDICRVDQNGLLKAVAPGETIIHATSLLNPEISTECPVRVNPR